MAQAVVTIAGRTYRMNCDEGEEPHIEGLAQIVDAKIAELRGAFGEIGDQRITVMAALTIADELVSAPKQLAAGNEAAARARAEAEDLRRREADWAERAAEALNEAAEQVETAARALGAEKS
jgi:cell division protein ZapA